MTLTTQPHQRQPDRPIAAPHQTVLKEAGAETPQGSSELFDRLYVELRRMASAQMMQLNPGQTLQATALVHEAFLKLAATEWTSEKAFFVNAAMAMRCVVLDNVKAKRRAKRGGGVATITLDGADIADGSIQSPQDILLFEEVMERLEELDPELRDLILLRHYAGLSLPQIARIYQIPQRTLERRWTLIRAMVLKERGQRIQSDHSNGS